MNILYPLLQHLPFLSRRNLSVASHLSGIEAVRSGRNHLWQELTTEANLEQAFDWLCEQTVEASHNSDVWDYRHAWPARRAELRRALLRETFVFQPVHMVEVQNEAGQSERIETRPAEDRLVIRALAQVLQPVLQPRLSPCCTHLAGNGGLHQAVRDTQDTLAAQPDSQVIKSDVKGYYAHIDHAILAEQLRALLPDEAPLHRLLWTFMRRTVEFGGNYAEIERGLPLGASLSPLFGAVYLSPLDALAKTSGGFYRRYMDDWVWFLPTRHALRRAVKLQYAVLQALRVETHPDKTFIGPAKKGFDFLGFHCCPTGVKVSEAALSRRDKKVARLYEQGASKQRIARYLVRWLGWAVAVMGACHSVACRAGVDVASKDWWRGYVNMWSYYSNFLGTPDGEWFGIVDKTGGHAIWEMYGGGGLPMLC